MATTGLAQSNELGSEQKRRRLDWKRSGHECEHIGRPLRQETSAEVKACVLPGRLLGSCPGGVNAGPADVLACEGKPSRARRPSPRAWRPVLGVGAAPNRNRSPDPGGMSGYPYEAGVAYVLPDPCIRGPGLGPRGEPAAG